MDQSDQVAEIWILRNNPLKYRSYRFLTDRNSAMAAINIIYKNSLLFEIFRINCQNNLHKKSPVIICIRRNSAKTTDVLSSFLLRLNYFEITTSERYDFSKMSLSNVSSGHSKKTAYYYKRYEDIIGTP